MLGHGCRRVCHGQQAQSQPLIFPRFSELSPQERQILPLLNEYQGFVITYVNQKEVLYAKIPRKISKTVPSTALLVDWRRMQHSGAGVCSFCGGIPLWSVESQKCQPSSDSYYFSIKQFNNPISPGNTGNDPRR